jgi:hypothetical protein
MRTGDLLAPEIEIFVQWLAATPYSWRLQADGRLRADDHGAVLCAVTAVARHREALAFSIGDWVRAADSFGLSYASAGLVVDAADGRATSTRVKRLRRRLLVAAGIGRGSALPAVAEPAEAATDAVAARSETDPSQALVGAER